jgi:hypothetical protein
MVRTLICGFLLIAAVHVAAADDTATPTPVVAKDTVSATSEATASAPATAASDDATKQGAKKRIASTKASDGKADPAAAASQSAQPGGDVKMSGMSILGNEDAPKSLVIVPWKSSQLADMPSVSRLLDSATQPVDKDVFMRELAYYEFKSSSK